MTGREGEVWRGRGAPNPEVGIQKPEFGMQSEDGARELQSPGRWCREPAYFFRGRVRPPACSWTYTPVRATATHAT